MTYRETFEKYLPKDVAELAIENTIKQNEYGFINNEVPKSDSEIGKALICGFVWDSTPIEQGHRYWVDIFDSVCNIEIWDI